jgi:hypothetical protein
LNAQGLDKSILLVNFHSIFNKFYSPDEVSKKYANKEIQLFPPQVYEMERLAHHNDIEKLSAFFINRQSKGVSTWLPKFARVNNQFIGYLPGKLIRGCCSTANLQLAEN